MHYNTFSQIYIYASFSGRGRTWGSETSHVPRGKESECDSVSSGERKRRSLNPATKWWIVTFLNTIIYINFLNGIY